MRYIHVDPPELIVCEAAKFCHDHMQLFPMFITDTKKQRCGNMKGRLIALRAQADMGI